MTRSLDDFEIAAREFLASRVPRRRPSTAQVWGEGSDRVALMEEPDPAKEAAGLAAARQWRATLFDAGFAWLTGPSEHGGQGLSKAYDQRFRDVSQHFDMPDLAPLVVGTEIVAPAIVDHGTEQLKRTYLRAIHRGDVVGCQLFSEPDAGSDLAGVKTRAVRDGETWMINGQKVWTSGAHLADVGEVLVRTGPDDTKHAGLSMFLIDMHQPGVEVRPLRQMTGGASFNEVFLNDVRVHDSHLIGPLGGGWKVALTSLTSERAAIGDPSELLPAGLSDRVGQLVRQLGRGSDPLVRQRLADTHIRSEILRMTNLRIAAATQAGQMPGPEASISKLLLTNNLAVLCQLLSELLGPRVAADSGEWGTFAWSELILGAPSLRIAGGTDEIQRNIIAERVLGLPREPPAS